MAYCPVSANVGKEFNCVTYDTGPGVTIKVGGAKALASGYTSSFVTTAYDNTKSIKYTERLFASKALINKNKTYKDKSVTITVTASKPGKKPEVRKVKVYEEKLMK